MQSASEGAKASLRAITEAAEVLQASDVTDVFFREAAFKDLFIAATGGYAPAKYFESEAAQTSISYDDWLSAATAADLEVRSAHVLVGVAAVHGELQPEPDKTANQLLQDAISDARGELDRINSRSSRANFVSSAPVVSASPSFDIALQSFRDAADATISKIVDESERVMSAVLDQIRKHATKMREALEAIMDLQAVRETFGGFLAKAWQKIQSALALLSQIVSSVRLEDLGEKIEVIRNRVTVRAGLESVYQIEKWRGYTKDLRPRSSASMEELDIDRAEISRLAEQFTRFASILRSTAVGLSVVATMLAAHLTGPFAALLLPALNAAVASVVIVVGLDYLGELRLGSRIRGIRGIEETLAGTNLA